MTIRPEGVLALGLALTLLAAPASAQISPGDADKEKLRCHRDPHIERALGQA